MWWGNISFVDFTCAMLLAVLVIGITRLWHLDEDDKYK